MPKRIVFQLSALLVILGLIFSTAAAPVATAQTIPDDPTGGGNPVVVDSASPSEQGKPDLSNVDLNRKVRFIVQLEDPQIALYKGDLQGLGATSTGGSKIDFASPAVVSYENYLVGKQTEFAQALAARLPGASVERSYRAVLNAVVVKGTMADLETLRNLPGVASVAVEQERTLQMDASLELIGLGEGTLGGDSWGDAGLWEAVGGHANAGAGIKIADIDSGITPSNPCFDPTGFTMPAGFPKGETTLTNAKIIAARSYFREDDLPYFEATALDDPGNYEGGHGTHTAGTMACNYGTTTTYSGIEISGVAPKAQLMVYRVFYYSESGSHSAYTPELLAAIEDAVRDGADVVNNSWGGTNINTIDDPEVAAFEAAVEAGVVVVFSAGNEGPGYQTMGSPGGNSEEFITVAASTTARTFTTTLDFVSVSDGSVTSFDPISGRSLVQESVTAQTIDLQAEAYADPIACNGPLPSALVSGKIVVVQRGVCALVDKVSYAKAGGAVGVVIRNVPAGATTLPLINPVLPTIHISAADGTALYNLLAGLADGVTATFTLTGPAGMEDADVADTLASFSSMGPTPDYQLKPDLAAPGVNILSSVSPMEFSSTETTFDFYQGTSMAAPHVTGAAALMVQLHPDWTPAEIRSALMTTTEEPVELGDNPAERGAGRLDLTEPDEVELTFDHPSLSYGVIYNGTDNSLDVVAKNMTGAEVTYDVTVVATEGDLPVVGSGGGVVTEITVPANGTTTFSVLLSPTADGSMYGKIVLAKTGSPELHLPYYAEVTTDDPVADVYLVDGDSSGYYPTCTTDYTPIYEAALTAATLTYTTTELDPDTGAGFDFLQARRHDWVLYIDGEPGCGGNLSYFFGNDVRNFLAEGGRMVVMGQDAAYNDLFYYTYYGRTFNPALFFGAKIVSDNLLDGAVMQTAGDPDYSPWVGGTVIGLDAVTTVSADEISPLFYTDVDAYPVFANKLAPAAVGDPYKGGMGTRMSSEPTIERVQELTDWTHMPYRTLLTSFGLENVTTPLDRETLVRAFNIWLTNETTVAFDESIFYTPKPEVSVSLSGLAVSSKDGSIEAYRVDFGDGSPIKDVAPGSSGEMVVSHKYAEKGIYNVYIEAIDEFGQKAVSTAYVSVGYLSFLPSVNK